MNLPQTILEDFRSYILQMQLEIMGGKSRTTAKAEFYRRIWEREGAKDLADLFFTYEAVLGERVTDKPSVNIYGGNFANVNFGEQIGTINASANAVAQTSPDGALFAEAIKSLTVAVTESADLKEEQKKDALEVIKLIGSQAELPPEKRNSGAFKSALSYLPTILSATASTIKIWDAFGPSIKSFFGV